MLGDILETLRFRGSLFFRSDLAAPWGMSLSKTGRELVPSARAGEACELGNPLFQKGKITNRFSRITDRLTEVLFLQLLNHYVQEHEGTTGFLAALRDRRVYRALSLIHQEPEFNWTLTSLGERVGMSRDSRRHER